MRRHWPGHSDDLPAGVSREALAFTRLDVGEMDKVVLGNAYGAGEDNRNVARLAALLAGPPTSPGRRPRRAADLGVWP